MEEEGLGPFLRRERLERGISLREVGDRTRIRTFYLERIEAGEFHRLPAIPIARGFVRAYAGCVGVDSDAAARRFDREVGCRRGEFTAPPAVEGLIFSEAASREGPHKLIVPVAAVAAFILASGAFLWFIRGKTDRLVPVLGIAERLKTAAAPAMQRLPIWNGATSPKGASPGAAQPRGSAGPASEKKPSAEGDGTTRPALGAADKNPLRLTPASDSAVRNAGGGGEEIAPAAPPAPPESGDGDEATGPLDDDEGPVPQKKRVASAPPRVGALSGADVSASPSPAEGAAAEGRLDLKVFAIEDTWLRVVVDEKKKHELLLTAGKEKNWRGAEKFILTVGNAAGTQVSLNGTKIPLPRTSTNVVRDFVVTEKLLN